MGPDTFDQSQPRIGRRESEPHSFEISYLHDVLTENLQEHHTLWDLHHYFQVEREIIDVQFDISFFLNWSLPYTLSSYRASEFGNRIPDVAINILSKSTWKTDLSENLDICRILKIPVYIVFCPFDVATKLYSPPFLRIYFLTQEYPLTSYKDLREVCIHSDGTLNLEHVIDLGESIPFAVGLQELEKKHEGSRALFRMVLVVMEFKIEMIIK